MERSRSYGQSRSDAQKIAGRGSFGLLLEGRIREDEIRAAEPATRLFCHGAAVVRADHHPISLVVGGWVQDSGGVPGGNQLFREVSGPLGVLGTADLEVEPVRRDGLAVGADEISVLGHENRLSSGSRQGRPVAGIQVVTSQKSAAPPSMRPVSGWPGRLKSRVTRSPSRRTKRVLPPATVGRSSSQSVRTVAVRRPVVRSTIQASSSEPAWASSQRPEPSVRTRRGVPGREMVDSRSWPYRSKTSIELSSWAI